MNNQQIDDLKQFITAMVSQTEANLDGKITGLDGKIESLRQEMQDGFAGVSDVIENLHNYYDEKIDTVGQRIKKLEQQSA